MYIYTLSVFKIYILISSAPQKWKRPAKTLQGSQGHLLVVFHRLTWATNLPFNEILVGGGKWQDPYNGSWNNPHINGLYNPLYTLNNQGFFHCSRVSQTTSSASSFKKKQGPSAPHRCHCPQWAVHLLRLDLPAARPPQPGISPQTQNRCLSWSRNLPSVRITGPCYRVVWMCIAGSGISKAPVLSSHDS